MNFDFSQNVTNNITDAFTQGTGKVTSKVSSYVFKVRGIPANAFLLVSWLHIMTYNKTSLWDYRLKSHSNLKILMRWK